VTSAPTTVPESVAGTIRARIRAGDLAAGTALPPLDQLMAHYQVSKMSMRQALLILESEGLVSVRRGRHGGAVIRSSPVDRFAELEPGWSGVLSNDLATALAEIEPLCAGLCAGRADRAETVLPYLEQAHAAGRASIDTHPERWSHHARTFHEQLVAHCGNAAIVKVVGALEAECSRRAVRWAAAGLDEPNFPVDDDDFRHRGLDDHQLILTFIARGDAGSAAHQARQHLQWVPSYGER